RIAQDSTSTTQLFEESFSATSSTSITYLARTQEFSSMLADGDVIAPRTRAETGSKAWPYGWYEITLRNFNIATLPFPTGLPPASPIYIAGGSPGSTLEYDTSAGLFDPTWFEDMETARFLESKVQSGILHLNAGNDSAQILSMNAVLEANVSTSSFNEALPPELSSTPNASLGFKLRD